MVKVLRVVIVLLGVVSLAAAFAQTIEAWGTLRPGSASTFATGLAGTVLGISSNTTITLATTRDHSYYASLDKGRVVGQAKWGPSGGFFFENVPIGVPVMLTITYSGKQGQATISATYKFARRPVLAFGKRQKEAAGYMGDFLLDPNAPSIMEGPNRYGH